MPTLDEQLARLLHDAAVEPDTAAALDAIATKRHHRAVVRRTRTVGALVASLLLVVGIAAVVWPSNETSPTVASPARGELTVQISDTASPRADREAVAARPIDVRAEAGFLRGPVVPSGEFVAVSAYDRNGGSLKVPPHRLIRIAADGRILDQVDLQGEVRSLTDGEGARWVLTHDPIVIGPADPEFWIKRIGPDGVLTSRAVPPGKVPNGEIVAAGGGLWVPVRDGVLRFDPATGDYAGIIPLADAEQRSVVNIGKGVVSSDGNALVRLDPSTMRAVALGAAAGDARIVSMTNGRGTWALVDVDGQMELRSVDLATGGIRTAGAVSVPAGFSADGVHANGSSMWITGSMNGRQGLLLLDTVDNGTKASIDRYVEIGSGQDISFTVMPDGELVAAVDGRLYRITLPT